MIKKFFSILLMVCLILLLSVCCSGCVAIRNEWEERFGDPSSQSDITTIVYDEFAEQMTVVLKYYRGKDNEYLYTEEYLLSKEDSKALVDALKPGEIEFSRGGVLKLEMEKYYSVYLNDNQMLEVYGILNGTNSDGYVRDYSHGGGYVDPSAVELLEEIVNRSELVKSVVLDMRTGEEIQTFPEVES